MKVAISSLLSSLSFHIVTILPDAFLGGTATGAEVAAAAGAGAVVGAAAGVQLARIAPAVTLADSLSISRRVSFAVISCYSFCLNWVN